MGKTRSFSLAIVFLLLLASTQATYHIRPTSELPCPHEDCLTLSEYTSQNRSYSNSDNLTLVFLPGEHALNSSIVFQFLESFVIARQRLFPSKYHQQDCMQRKLCFCPPERTQCGDQSTGFCLLWKIRKLYSFHYHPKI